MDTKLQPLLKEPTFWVLLAISLPGLVAAYMAAILAVVHGDAPDTDTLLLAVTGSPIGLYLGIGRQYARGKAVEAAPHTIVPVITPGAPVDAPRGVV
jgi:hypothetical protein